MAAIIVMLVISVILFLTGLIWTLKLRGKTTRRSGTEVGAELMAENMARRARLDGKASLARKTWFWGKGWAVDWEASYSYAEIKTMWRERAFGALLPVMLAAGGMLGIMLLGGILLLMILPSRIPGLIALAAGLYGAWLICTGIRRA